MTATPRPATSAGVEPVAAVEDLTAEWLSQALGTQVSGVSATRVGTGQMGECHRLDLHGSPGLPPTILAKLPASEAATRDFLHGSYAIEVTFYRELLATVDVRAPKAYYAQISDDPARRGVFTLLLEDLTPAAQGDQIVGCTPEQALRAVVNVAGLHAPRWADPSLLEVDGLSLPEQADADLMDSFFGEAVSKVVAQLGDLISADDARTLDEVAPYGGLWSLAHHDRFSLVHGDYRLDNLLFHPDGRLWAVDWQTLALGLPPRDVAFMVSSGLTTTARRTHERAIVEAYHQRLLELGVTGYSSQQCWEDHRFGQLQTLLIAVFGCAYSSVRTERGDRMFAVMIDRGCQAVRDLATMDMLRAL